MSEITKKHNYWKISHEKMVKTYDFFGRTTFSLVLGVLAFSILYLASQSSLFFDYFGNNLKSIVDNKVFLSIFSGLYIGGIIPLLKKVFDYEEKINDLESKMEAEGGSFLTKKEILNKKTD